VQVVEAIEALRIARHQLPGRVGLVPTMGALHAGHRSLVKQAQAENDSVITTIFVNPTQFGPEEDLSNYPHDLSSDLDIFRDAGVDLVFVPDRFSIYPPGYQTYIEVEDVSQGLEGAYREGHFRGVATIVAKLFNLIQPDVAYFGQKDAQQVVVIRQMVRDLNFPLDIAVCPTVREPDGLAMSSRNAYLKPAERIAASVLHRALNAAASAYEGGQRNPKMLREIMHDVLQAESLARVEYVSVADAKTLRELEASSEEPALLSLAVRIGEARLIDNMLLPLSLNELGGATTVLGQVS
jgi:pantoate--beta-alanine ligase